jgi:hypothetical protein
MKKASGIVLVLVVLLLVPTNTLYAQSNGMSFNVPFAFVVADRQMPAGQYHVTSLYWNAVAITVTEGKGGVITLAQPTTLPEGAEPKLIFHKYAKHYFLSEARLPGMDAGRKFYISKEEAEIAGNLPKPENVEVAAK